MRHGIAILGASFVLGTIAIGCGKNTERREVDFERMRVQQRVDAYAASAALPNGMAMQGPPAGTISREQNELGDSVAIGRRSAVKAIPLPITTKLLNTGEHEFGIYCAVCHGADGSGGTASVVGMNIQPLPPSLVTSSLSAGDVFGIITNGRGRMPAYAWALPPTDRWAIIAYLQNLQRGSQGQ
jgi:mono/diheme cytochrome c family protein